MTIATADSRVQYTGNGSTTVFDFEFIVPEEASLRVVKTDLTTNDSVTLGGGDYSVTGIGSDDGGSVTLVGPAVSSNFRITIYREIEYVQSAEFTNQDGFYPEVVETTFDRLVMMIQQLVDRLSRALVSDPSGNTIDAGGLEIINVGAPTHDNSAARRIDVDNASMAAGNVPVPGAGASGRFLRALTTTTWGWVTFTLAMIADASALGRQLVAAPSAAAMRSLLEIPDAGPGDAVPPGTVAMFPQVPIPAGWLECDGTAINRVTYAGLFAALGTGYGVGDGSTTFNLPDYRGLFPRGWDHSRGIDPGRGLGTNQDQAVGVHAHTASATSSSSLTMNAVADHTHSASAVNNVAVAYAGGSNGSLQPSGTVFEGSPGSASVTIGAGGAHTPTGTVATSTGVTVNNSAGPETRPINFAIQFIIKT